MYVGFRRKKKRKELFNWLKLKKLDIICLQETYSTPEDVKKWKLQWGGEIIFAHGTSAAKGVCVLINNRSEVKISEINCDKNGRYIIVSLSHRECEFVLVNIYAPNHDNPEFLMNYLNRLLKQTMLKLL